MKHGLIALVLLCWLVGALPAESPPARVALTIQELEAVDGGDLFLSVNRDKQMMTVTRITPGSYDNIQCFSLSVTTSVVRNRDVTPDNPKNAMENSKRKLTAEDSTLVPPNEARTPTQFPSGTATLSPVVGTQPKVTGPVVRTNATQPVKVEGNADGLKVVPDTGYNVHFVDPVKATNTFGCIGVQSQAGMAKVVAALTADTASYKPGTTPKQTITVSPFSSQEKPKTTSSTPAPSPAPAPAPSPSPPAPKKSSPMTSTQEIQQPW